MMEDHGSNNLLVRMATQGTTMNILFLNDVEQPKTSSRV